MLKKLLKYDMRQVWRIWWIIAVGVLGAAILFGGCIRAGIGIDIPLDDDDVSPFFGIAKILLFIIAYLGYLGICFAIMFTELYVYYRTYKNLYSDEAYLTFMLPVKRRTLFDEKMLHCVIWQLLALVLIICTGAVMLFSGFAGTEVPSLYKEIFETILADVPQELGSAFPLICVEFVLLAVGSCFAGSSMVLMCLTLGSVIAKKHKLLASIGVYYAISFVTGIITSFASMFLVTSAWFNSDELTDAKATATIVIVLGAAAALSVILTLVYRAITIHMMNKKLNLAA